MFNQGDGDGLQVGINVNFYHKSNCLGNDDNDENGCQNGGDD